MRINCFYKFAATILLLLICVGSAVGDIQEVEREALIALYNSTNGDNWTRNYYWLDPKCPECRWEGVTCQFGKVSRLNLRDNNLVGQIPPELGNLESCALILKNNKLSGSIPPELGNVGGIGIDLSYNQLSGSIPPELANNIKAQLFLHNNQLSGSIPPELAEIPLVVYIELYNNNLSGSIPPEFGTTRNLKSLDLRNNELSGPIPPELGKLAKLLRLGLSGNQLSGPIPPELRNLKNLQKKELDFRYNALYTDDISLRDFLNSKQLGGDWEGTQTVAPTDITADALTGDSIKVSWTPIRFTEFSGGYRVFFSTSSGGPYTLSGTTADKNTSFLNVTGLNPGTTYYFVIQTVTHPHDLNKNTVTSEYSEEAIGGRGL